MGKRTSVYLTGADLAAITRLGRTPLQLIRDGIASHDQAAATAAPRARPPQHPARPGYSKDRQLGKEKP